MVCQQRQPHGHRVMARFEQLRYEDQVAERLGHFLAVQADHAGMRVAPGERVWTEPDPSVGRAHLMVRENQVPAARLYVEGLTEVVSRDGRALHVPAGTTGAELGWPGRLARAFGQPHHRVERVLLTLPAGVPAAL